MARSQRVVVVKRERSCLVTAILICVLIILLIILAPVLLSCLGVGAALLVGSQKPAAESETNVRRAPVADVDLAPAGPAERATIAEEPPPPSTKPAEWDEYQLASTPDTSGSEKENQERLLGYDRAVRKIVIYLPLTERPNLKRGLSSYLGVVYRRLCEAEPEFVRLPKLIQRGFLKIMHQFELDRSTVTKVAGIRTLAAEWSAER